MTTNNGRSNQSWRKNPEYLEYCTSGEATAVYIVRDLCKRQINTHHKWIDCIALDCWQDRNDNWKFKFIVVELFPRINNPEYTDDVDYNRYLTWKTAHEDIAQYRAAGTHGPLFRVRCWLIDKNAGKFTTEHVWYDLIDKCWICDGRLVHPENSEIRERHYPLEPEWTYRIDEAIEITQKQAQKYIKRCGY